MSGEIQSGPSEGEYFESAEDALARIQLICEGWRRYDERCDADPRIWMNLNWRAAARARNLLIWQATVSVRPDGE
jgi:hypothetical protein